MQRFSRSAVHTHSVGVAWPTFLGTVQLGESFVLETERDGGVNGPIEIATIRAGQPIAVQLEAITMVGPFRSTADPFDASAEPVDLEFHDGCFYFPRNFRVQANPTVGNIGVLPKLTPEMEASVCQALARGERDGWRKLLRTPQGRHCHQDCPWLSAGTTLHVQAQVDGAGLCLADVHGYRPSGRLAHRGVEVAADVQLSVKASQGWLVDWPLIETDDRIMVMVSPPTGAEDQAERLAYLALRQVVQARTGASAAEANALVATAVELLPCAGAAPVAGAPGAITMVAALPKDALSPR